MKNILALTAVAGLASFANADVIISELLGSTGGSDAEYIEIYNAGASSVDLTGWSIELWDSDSGTPEFGGSDGVAPYGLSGSLASGETFTLGNSLATGIFGFIWDALLPADAIENSSYTAVLVDGMGNAVFSAFVADGDAGDVANRAGVAIAADVTVGPDGSFLPAGFRIDDADLNFSLLNFSDPGAAPADPGVANFAPIPAPSALALVGLGGLVAGRRRR
jgi:hypothetical protein